MVSSDHSDPEALRIEWSYTVSSHLRSYGLIRLPDRLLPISLPVIRKVLGIPGQLLPVYQTLPSLTAYLSPVATIHTPGSGSGALAYSFPDPIGHRRVYIRLALPSPSTSIGFMWRCLTTL
jgi:hypothetical protein